MNLRRGATETIWKTVVFAGAMLGSAAGCGNKSKPPVAPSPDPSGQQADPNDPDGKKQPDPCADPCAEQDPCAWTDPCGDGRARGSADPCEGGEGRGFILS